MNISPINVEKANPQAANPVGSRNVQGFKTQEEACEQLISACIGEKFPQYVKPLFRYFQQHELAFNFLDAGLTIPREDGISFTLDVESEGQRKGMFSYAPVKVNVTWTELDQLIAEGKV